MTSTQRRESGSGGRMWTGGGGQAPCGRPHRKLKLESNDVILSSSPDKKLLLIVQLKINYNHIVEFQEGHCTSRFKRAMCISCRPHVDIHKEERGDWLMWTHVDRGEEGVKT